MHEMQLDIGRLRQTSLATSSSADRAMWKLKNEASVT